jgi:membrane-associated protease RseP (regulator of RpoE activity)
VRAVVLFCVTTVSCWFTYGFFWGGGDVTSDPVLAWKAAQYAGALMGILLAHEMGHYVVARRHGLDQSLPQFIPFPMAFGTLGAIIRLRSLPQSRTVLLEVGAAGPLAGFAVAIVVMAIGLPGTVEHAAPIVVTEWPLPPLEAPGPYLTALGGVLSVLGTVIEAIADVFGGLPEIEPFEGTPLLVLANPALMDGLGHLVLGGPPGRYADIPPLVLAAWAGCFVTAMNLLPIGQLDGGHIFNSLAPTWARKVSLVGVGVIALCGMLWGGWLMWAGLLGLLGAWRSLPLPERPLPSRRARVLAGLAVIAFVACFMPTPIEDETWSYDDLIIETESGERISAEEYRAALRARAGLAGEGEGTEESDPARPDGPDGVAEPQPRG